MTITIKRSTAAVLICLVGSLGGLAIGQVATAFSSGGEATASGNPTEKTLKKLNKTVGKMKRRSRKWTKPSEPATASTAFTAKCRRSSKTPLRSVSQSRNTRPGAPTERQTVISRGATARGEGRLLGLPCFVHEALPLGVPFAVVFGDDDRRRPRLREQLPGERGAIAIAWSSWCPAFVVEPRDRRVMGSKRISRPCSRSSEAESDSGFVESLHTRGFMRGGRPDSNRRPPGPQFRGSA